MVMTGDVGERTGEGTGLENGPAFLGALDTVWGGLNEALDGSDIARLSNIDNILRDLADQARPKDEKDFIAYFNALATSDCMPIWRARAERRNITTTERAEVIKLLSLRLEDYAMPIEKGVVYRPAVINTMLLIIALGQYRHFMAMPGNPAVLEEDAFLLEYYPDSSDRVAYLPVSTKLIKKGTSEWRIRPDLSELLDSATENIRDADWRRLIDIGSTADRRRYLLELCRQAMVMRAQNDGRQQPDRNMLATIEQAAQLFVSDFYRYLSNPSGRTGAVNRKSRRRDITRRGGWR